MKNTTKGLSAILILIAILFVIPGCQKNEQAGDYREVFQMSPSSRGVDEFLEQHYNKFPSEFGSGTCYNVTPEIISGRFGFDIYKFDTSCESLLLYKDQVYPLGEWFGGLGVTSFAVTDLNKDGSFELYFTYSWGSGIPRSLVGYFNSADNQVVTFDFTAWFKEMVLGTDTDGNLCVYEAECDIDSFVDIKLVPGAKIGSIVCAANNILFEEEEAEKK